jgi:hypothetical protein
VERVTLVEFGGRLHGMWGPENGTQFKDKKFNYTKLPASFQEVFGFLAMNFFPVTILEMLGTHFC